VTRNPLTAAVLLRMRSRITDPGPKPITWCDHIADGIVARAVASAADAQLIVRILEAADMVLDGVEDCEGGEED
jgi:hypothetical protein